jgi:hypothetical protein
VNLTRSFLERIGSTEKAVLPFQRPECRRRPDRLVGLGIELPRDGDLARLHLSHLDMQAQQREEEDRETGGQHEHADHRLSRYVTSGAVALMAPVMTWNLQEARVLLAARRQFCPLTLVASHVSFGRARPTSHCQNDQGEYEESHRR